MSSTGAPHTDHPTTTGQRIKTLRQNLGLTQRQLAEQAGVHRSVIAKLEAGEIQKTTWLPQLADVLCSSALFLSTGKLAQTPTTATNATTATIPHGSGADPPNFREIVLVRVLEIAEGGGPQLTTHTAAIPARFLPHMAAESLALANVGNGRYAIAEMRPQVSDGMHTLLAWRGSLIAAKVHFTETGYRLERLCSADELSTEAFESQIQVLGRIVVLIDTHIL
ncbi:helix-turn-helix transcriptional regulator [Paucibacter sp. DJ4R-1]|nr:helix-turn-helix transcriptional regulator [Paucibacter sp. DJ4R-1]